MTDVEPIDYTLPAVFEFANGLVLPGQMEVIFLADTPLEVGCIFRAGIPTPEASPGSYLSADFVLERDAMVRACLLPGLGTYGTGDYRIGRRPGDKIRIGLEPLPGSDLVYGSGDQPCKAVCTVYKADLERFLQRTLEMVEIGEAEEARIIETSLDRCLEEILSSGK